MNPYNNGEVESVLNFLASLPADNSTTTAKVFREIQLKTGGQMLARGRLYDIVGKKIAPGVYRLSLELANVEIDRWGGIIPTP